MMHSLFDVTLLDSTLVQAALRALALALVVGAALILLRVRNPHHQLAAWTAVLAGALAMPLLMTWMVVELPAQDTTLPIGRIAEPLIAATMPADVVAEMPAGTSAALSAGTSDAALTPRIDGALESTSEPFDWSGVILAVYAGIAGLLLLRLAVGLILTARIRTSAARVTVGWAQGNDIRVTKAIAAPVTIGSTILLPADFESWSAEKRAAVLLHECAHVARGDFYIQSLAAVHRAVFWFSPLAWWLHDRLAELAEDASDAEAASKLPYRADYAAVLLDFAQIPTPPRFKVAPLGVAMARPATVSRRIERVLAEKGLPRFVSRGARAATAMAVVAIACTAAVSFVRSPAEAAVAIATAPLPAATPVNAAAGETCPVTGAVTTPAASLLPISAARPVAPISPVAPIAPLVPGAPLAPIPPVEFGTHGRDVLGPPIHIGGSSVRADHPDIDVQFDIDKMREAIEAAKAQGGGFDDDLAARIEAQVERAQARAQARVQARADAAVARSRERQYAAVTTAGEQVRETRNVEAFTGVSFGGSGKVFITVGSKSSVVLEGDSVVIGRTRTEVENGVLRIRARNDDNFQGNGDIIAHITVPELKSARVSGSGDLKVVGLNGGETALSISGSGNVEADGKLQELDLDISGSGNARMTGLIVNQASVAISGSGSAVVDVRDDLNVRVSGSGSVRYLTQPKDVSTSISGSGSVRRRDAT